MTHGDSGSERTRARTKSPKRIANAETLFTASRSPPSARISVRVVRGWIRVAWRDHARSRPAADARDEESEPEYLQFPPASPFRSPLARAFAIDDSRFYVSLFVVAARRATATGVRGDIRRNCEGCERVETARATSAATGRFERERGRIPPLYL